MSDTGRFIESSVTYRGPLRPAHVHQTDIILIGQDVLYGTPGEVASVDARLPIRLIQRPQPDFATLRNSAALFFVDAPLLFTLSQPVLRIQRLLQDIMHGTDTDLIGQDVIYGAPGQAPNYNLPNPPRGYIHPLTNKWWEQDELNANLLSQDSFPPGGQLTTAIRLVV